MHSQLTKQVITHLDSIWNTEKQLLTALPKLQKMTSSMALYDFQDEQQLTAVDHLQEIEKLCAAYLHTPQLQTENELKRLISDAEGVSGVLQNYNVAEAIMLTIAGDIQHSKQQKYIALLSCAKQINDSTAVAVIQNCLADEAHLNKRLSYITNQAFRSVQKQRMAVTSS